MCGLKCCFVWGYQALTHWLAGSLAGGSRIPGVRAHGRFRLQQTKLAGPGDRFGAPVDLKFAKEAPRVSFHRVQGKE